jgi:lysophospholipase
MDGDFTLLETPESRAPMGARLHVAIAKGGSRLRVLVAPSPVTDTSKGTVVLMNGRGEFLERYYETMRDLQARGFHVVGFDWRGQGLSTRQVRNRMKGHISSFKAYDDDLAAVLDLVARHCPKPYFAIAHSTGGHILMRNLVDKSFFKRAVVTAPLFGFIYGKWPKAVASFLSSVALAVGLGRSYLPGYAHGPFLLHNLKENPLTSDTRRWARDKRMLEAHPELGVGGPTFGWFNAALRSFAQLEGRRYSKGLNCPVMIVLAGRERVVDNAATNRFIDRTPGLAKVTINSSLHEILMETDAIRAEFFAVFESFVSEAN